MDTSSVAEGIAIGSSADVQEVKTDGKKDLEGFAFWVQMPAYKGFSVATR